MTGITPDEYVQADYGKFNKQNGEFFVKTTSNNTLVTEKYDYVGIAYPTATSETYTYKLGGSSGTLVATVTITYVDSTKAQVSSIAKA